MYLYKTGDPCPCCGRPIPITNPEALYYFSVLCAQAFPDRVPPAESTYNSKDCCDFVMVDPASTGN